MDITLTENECKYLILVAMSDIENAATWIPKENSGIDIERLSKESTIDIENLVNFIKELSTDGLVQILSDRNVVLTDKGHEYIKNKNSLPLSEAAFLMLQKSYEIYIRGGYDDSIQFNSFMIGCYVGISNHNKANSAAKFLVDNGYCRNPAIMRDFIIYFLSNKGIAYMESDHTAKKEAKQVSVTNNFYSDVSNSQIQQFSDNSTQNMSTGVDIEKINGILRMFEENYKNLDEKYQLNITHEIETIKVEIKKQNPENSKIKKCFGTIRNILEGIAGNIIAAGLLHYINDV
jgi:predicted transcriptional regulator